MSNEEKILELLGKMDGDIREMRGDIQGLKDDMQGVKSEIQGLKDDMQGVKSDIQSLNTRLDEVDKNARWSRLMIENKILPDIQMLVEHQSDIWEKMATRRQVELLREDLNLERFRIDVLAERAQ